MTGYRGDVLVTVLRLDEFGQMNFCLLYTSPSPRD